MKPEEIAALLYEGVADDEAIRGNLRDAGYAPLLRWAALRAAQLAPAAGEYGVERLAEALRGAMRGLVHATETGTADVLEDIDRIAIPDHLREQVWTALAAAPDPDARAAAMAKVLMEGRV